MAEAAGTTAGKRKAGRGQPDGHRPGDRRPNDHLFDRELDHLPPDMRWREWMGRVEAVIFAAAAPVSRDDLARVVGKGCNLDLIIDDIRDEVRGRPYELVSVAGGWQHRTRPAYADAIRAAAGGSEQSIDLSQSEALVLMTIAYFQPITRAELSSFFGREISRDLIGNLRGAGFIASGPRSPTPGAPYTYVTTKGFLSHFGFETLRDLPDMEKLEDAGLLNKEKLLANIPGALGAVGGESEFLDDGGSSRAYYGDE
jgi:segregation and condensation protein B